MWRRGEGVKKSEKCWDFIYAWSAGALSERSEMRVLGFRPGEQRVPPQGMVRLAPEQHDLGLGTGVLSQGLHRNERQPGWIRRDIQLEI